MWTALLGYVPAMLLNATTIRHFQLVQDQEAAMHVAGFLWMALLTITAFRVGWVVVPVAVSSSTSALSGALSPGAPRSPVSFSTAVCRSPARSVIYLKTKGPRVFPISFPMVEKRGATLCKLRTRTALTFFAECCSRMQSRAGLQTS